MKKYKYSDVSCTFFTNNNQFIKIEEKPNFSLNDLKKSIPNHCWKRDSIISLYYFFRDYFFIFGIYFLCYIFYDIMHRYICDYFFNNYILLDIIILLFQFFGIFKELFFGLYL